MGGGGVMAGRPSGVDLWVRLLVGGGLLLGATCFLGLSVFAVEDEVTGVGDADSIAGGWFCLVSALLQLAVVSWLLRRVWPALVLSGLLTAVAVVIGAQLVFS